MRYGNLVKAASVTVATTLLFTGCFSFDIKFDLEQMDSIGAQEFTDALGAIGVPSNEIDHYEQYIYFDETEESRFDVQYSLSTETDNCMYYFIVCASPEEAHRLFEYSSSPYTEWLDGSSGTFTGRRGDYDDRDGAYSIIDGEFTDDEYYYVIYNAFILRGDKVLRISVTAETEETITAGKKEADAFIDALGIDVF
ncbi:MAG: hypothetical protein K5745_06255 [Saccharofermentans sp.]|nr:hypothetical protein [Saccharofermentans sp.]